jgi:hypothetical protein
MPPEIRDIKPTIDLPITWWPWVLLGLVIAAAGFILFINGRKIFAQTEKDPFRLPWEKAMQQLRELDAKQYPDSGEYKTFYIQLSLVLRHYLEEQCHIKAPEMTTEEFLSSVKTSAVLREDHKALLKDFLNGCDMVKFARHTPSVSQARSHFDLVVRLIDETKMLAV